MLKGRKNDFSIIAFYSDRQPLKLTYVHTVGYKLFTYLRSKGSLKYINVYNRRTREFLIRYYNDRF